MKKIVFFISTLAFFLASCTQNKTPEFDHYGVYLQNGNEYVELKEGSTAKPIEIEVKDEVALYVYHPQAKTQEYGLRGFYSYELVISPVKDNDEMVKIVPTYLWGGYVFQVDNQERYIFMINDENITEKLKSWMLKVIDFYENKDYDNFFNSAFPAEVKKGIIYTRIREMEVKPEKFEDWINLAKTHVDKIENGEVTIFIERSAIQLDEHGDYIYVADENWEWSAR